MRKLFILTTLFFFTENYAQNYELGKVTLDELKEKACPFDTSATAAYIFKDKIITYESFGSIVTITRVKLKIYKKEGYNYANIKEVFSKSDPQAGFSEAYTYNLENGEIVKHKLEKESEFKENLDENLITKKIAFPDVKEGSIIEYKIINHEGTYFRPVNFYFQDAIPIKSIILTVEFPARFEYNKNLSGYLSPSVRNETLGDHINVRELKNRSTYQLLNVPAMTDEGYVNNINNYRSRIQYELASFENDIGRVEKIATDWKTITQKIYKSEDFGEELLKTGYFEKELDEALVDKNSRIDRVNAVLAFVKSKVKWNNNYGVGCEKGVKKAYKDKIGNAADINLMLTAMLRYAGVNANPVLITTRSKLINLFPSLTSNNYVIAGVETGEEVIPLDATSEYSLPYVIPLRNLNSHGRIIRKDGTSEQFDITPKEKSQDIVNLIGVMSPDGEVSGKIREKYSDYKALIYRENYNDVPRDLYIDKLGKKYDGVEVSDFEVKNNTDLTQPVVEEYGFKTNKGVETIGDKIYFSPLLFFAKTENPFKSEKREYPIDFIFPKEDKFIVSITIPEGYAVEKLPEGKIIAMPDGLTSFTYTISAFENKIQMQCFLDINQAVIEPEYYEALKNFFKEIVNKQTEKIVLKKV